MELAPGRLAMFDGRVREHDAARPGYAAQWAQLSGMLLSAAGIAVVPMPWADDQLDQLVARGDLVRPARVEDLPIADNQCHSSVAAVIRQHPAGVTAGTGYALSADELWRSHSWLMSSVRSPDTSISATIPLRNRSCLRQPRRPVRRTSASSSRPMKPPPGPRCDRARMSYLWEEEDELQGCAACGRGDLLVWLAGTRVLGHCMWCRETSEMAMTPGGRP